MRDSSRPEQQVARAASWAAGLCLTWVAVPAEGPAASPGTSDPVAAITRAAKIIATGTNTLAIGHVTVEKTSRAVRIPAVVNMRERVIEYALVTRAGKTHEALFATDASPTDVHVAALLVGLTAASLYDQTNRNWIIPEASAVAITATWQEEGRVQRRSLSDLVGLTESEPDVITRPLAEGPWFYNGSRLLEGGGFIAEQGGSIISLIFDPDALVNNPHADRDDDDIHFPYTSRLPPVGTAVTIELTPVRARNEASSPGEGRERSPQPDSQAQTPAAPQERKLHDDHP